MLTWDNNKAAANFAKHGVLFESARQFDWDTAVIVADDRRDYGERRFVATGRIDDRLYVLVFTARGARVRVISLRKANPRETKRYDQTQDH